jgi:hypothetical protein
MGVWDGVTDLAGQVGWRRYRHHRPRLLHARVPQAMTYPHNELTRAICLALYGWRLA